MEVDTPDNDRRGIWALGMVSLVAGAATGLVGALFRICLERADQLRDLFVGWAAGIGAVGVGLVVVACAVAAAVAAWLVRRFSPHAAGSGIPHVEAVLSGKLPPAPFVLVPVKFLGGVLAIGAGLALGREGPSVQIGSSIAHLCGKLFGRNWADIRVLMAAGAGAGLATAFNAPMAGAIFVLEELVRRFETRIAIAALGASATAMAVARLFLGDAPEFHVAALPYSDLQTRVLFLALGIAVGFVGVAYNYTLVGMIRSRFKTWLLSLFHRIWQTGMSAPRGSEMASSGFERLARWTVELRAGVVGALVGLLAYFAPKVVGGGELLTQHTFDGMFALRVLPLILLTRFFLGPLSYAARTPGGLFAPILVIGAQFGLLFGAGCHYVLPELTMPNEAFAVVGMAAFFTAVVRAPITGITLIIEMTGSFPLLLPMLFACFTAMLVPTFLANRPIYESLREKR